MVLIINMIATHKHSGKLKIWSVEMPNEQYLNHSYQVQIT